MENLIGKKGIVILDGLEVEVEILDTRQNYGRTDLKITAGHNSKWVNINKVNLKEE
jgi:hypothetical protein